jgi:hypothetical protein
VDESFDAEMRFKFGCVIHSFDPLIEAERFKKIRQLSSALSKNSIKLKVDEKWTFYKLGLTGEVKKEKTGNEFKFGDLLYFEQILDLTATRGKVVDVVKIDIEEAEVAFLQTMDMDYFCKYVKQFVIETHLAMPADLIYKLEKCFYLFHRDARFMLSGRGAATGWLSEWQMPEFQLDLKIFKNELELAKVLFTRGELYFVNLNFLLHNK